MDFMAAWFDFKALWYRLVRSFCCLAITVYFRFRYEGQHYVPDVGGALLLSSHQSLLDPVLLAITHRRPFHYLARKSLFVGPIGTLLRSLNGIPIDQDGSGISGLKETLRQLKRREIVLIFPEGTRTPNGQVQTLKPGFAALARRCKVPLVPVAIVGAYDCWPRRQRFPRPGRIRVQYGPPFTPEEFADYDDQQLVDEMERRIRVCHEQAAAKHFQPGGAPGWRRRG